MKLLHLQNLLVADQPEKRTQEIKLSTRNVVNRDFEGKMAGQHEQRSIRIQGKVIGADANPGKLARALELGANAAYTPEQLEENGLKAPLVIEAAGHPRAFETAVAVTAVGGRTVTVGLPSPEARSTISPLTLTAEARTIVGSYLGSAVPSRDIPVYEDLWRQGKLPVEELISGQIELSDINAGLDRLANGEAIRQVSHFD